MKKLSISVFAILAIAVAVTSAFTTKAKFNQTRFVAFTVAASTNTTDPNNAWSAKEDVVRQPNLSAYANLSAFESDLVSFYSQSDISDVCEAGAGADPICAAEIQVTTTDQGEILSIDEEPITKVVEGSFAL